MISALFSKSLGPETPLGISRIQVINDALSVLELRLFNVQMSASPGFYNHHKDLGDKQLSTLLMSDSSLQNQPPKDILGRVGYQVIQGLIRRPLSLAGALFVLLVAELIVLGFLGK